MTLAAIDSGLLNILHGIGQLLVLLLILAFVLFLAYYTSKLTAKFQNNLTKGQSMSVVETIRLQDGKFLQIVKVSDRYIVLGLGKEEITYICELDEMPERVEDSVSSDNSGFLAVLNKFTAKDNNSANEVNDESAKEDEE
jgi:flagellar protein FliO/FliZ